MAASVQQLTRTSPAAVTTTSAAEAGPARGKTCTMTMPWNWNQAKKARELPAVLPHHQHADRQTD